MDQKFELSENRLLQKSNQLVSAKYKSSLIENQIMAIALTRIEVNANDANSPIASKLYPGELKRLIGDPTNIYKTLKKVSKTMTGHTMFIEDGKGNFKAFAVVTNADYYDGVFTVEFNKQLREHVLGLEKNYTTLELSVLTGFKKNSSFRLYELLKSHIYKSRKEINDGRVDVEYNISELRFMIGLANGDDPSVKNAMAAMSNNIDWDDLYMHLDKKDRKYEAWYDFTRYVIDPAQTELKEKSNIRFEYEGIRDGHRMSRIMFFVYPNNPSNTEVIDERQRLIEANALPNRQMEIPLDTYPQIYVDYIGHNKLSKEDIDLLMQKAGLDEERVREVIQMADEQPNISNYMGWLIKAIENNYTRTDVLEGSAEKAEVFREVLDSYEKNKEDIATKAWNKIKTKKEFPAFVKAVEEGGLDIEQIEVIYSPQELTKAFTDWNKGRGINL